MCWLWFRLDRDVSLCLRCCSLCNITSPCLLGDSMSPQCRTSPRSSPTPCAVPRGLGKAQGCPSQRGMSVPERDVCPEEGYLSQRGMGTHRDIGAHAAELQVLPSSLRRVSWGVAGRTHSWVIHPSHGHEQPLWCSREGQDAQGLHWPPPLVTLSGGEGVNSSLQCRSTKVHYFC